MSAGETFLVGDRGKIPALGPAIALAADVAMRERRTVYVRSELEPTSPAAARAEYLDGEGVVEIHVNGRDPR